MGLKATAFLVALIVLWSSVAPGADETTTGKPDIPAEKTRAIKGDEFSLRHDSREREQLVAFLRTLYGLEKRNTEGPCVHPQPGGRPIALLFGRLVFASFALGLEAFFAALGAVGGSFD
jgi:hypothetical protein